MFTEADQIAHLLLQRLSVKQSHLLVARLQSIRGFVVLLRYLLKVEVDEVAGVETIRMALHTGHHGQHVGQSRWYHPPHLRHNHGVVEVGPHHAQERLVERLHLVRSQQVLDGLALR